MCLFLLDDQALRRLLPGQIQAQLEAIVNAENIASEEEALTVLARAADGSLRDALSLLDQAIAFGGGAAVQESDVRNMLGSLDQGQVIALLRALASARPTATLTASGVARCSPLTASTRFTPSRPSACAATASIP